MSYNPTNWKTGDVIVADKLNKIENGIKSIDNEYIVTNWKNGDIITADKSNKIENSIKSIDDEYIVTNWKNGDIITADKLNKIEQALAAISNKDEEDEKLIIVPEQTVTFGSDGPVELQNIQNTDKIAAGVTFTYNFIADSVIPGSGEERRYVSENATFEFTAMEQSGVSYLMAGIGDASSYGIEGAVAFLAYAGGKLMVSDTGLYLTTATISISL